jgi:hypothetical protein
LVATTVCLATSAATHASDDVAGSPVLLNDNAAWSWFEDERAIVDPSSGQLLVSSVANGSGSGGGARNGDIELATLNLADMSVTQFQLHNALQADDHNSAAMIVRPDGRYLAMYGQHVAGGESGQQSYYRISINPGDASSWGGIQSFDNNASMTYSNLHYLPNDGSGAGRMYNFVRTNNFDPNILISSDEGTTWSYGGKLLTEGGGGDRPYVRYWSDEERIHFITTERHPRDFDNSIYYGSVQNGQLFDATGTIVDDDLFDNSGVAPSALTTVFQAGTVVGGATMRRAWTVDTAVNDSGNPVVVFQARADGNDTDHRFFYGQWTGADWQVNQMAYAGSYLYAAENDYTGLVAIDPNHPDTVYLSSEVHPATQTQLIGADGLRHYELFRGRTNDGGVTWGWTPLTFNSTQHNVRPLVPEWDEENTALVWLRGDYFSYTNYDMDAVTLINPDVEEPELALAVDFGATGQVVQTGFDPFTRDAVPIASPQTETYASAFGVDGEISVTVGGGNIDFRDRESVDAPLGDIAADFVFLDGDLSLTFGNLVEGDYHLVLYAHDRDFNQLTYDIILGESDLGTLNPITGADPAIGFASSRVAFATDGVDDVTFNLDGIGSGANVVLNGFELYSVEALLGPQPAIDLNGDGRLDLLDFEMYVGGLHADLSGLSAQEAFRNGDLNGDFQNNFNDFNLFKNAYDQWNGAGAFAAALTAVPEPSTFGLLLVGFALGTRVRTDAARTEAANIRSRRPDFHTSSNSVTIVSPNDSVITGAQR